MCVPEVVIIFMSRDVKQILFLIKIQQDMIFQTTVLFEAITLF